MSIGGFEVAIEVELRRVPEAASEVGEQRQLRPELPDFSDEDGVLVDRAQGVEERVLFAFYGPRYLVYAFPLLPHCC